MCMGLGCNAAGVVGCRIMDSPRQRLLAVLTNGFIPCNGRLAGLILLLTVCLIPRELGSLGAALGLTGLLTLSVGMTMLVCRVLSRTVLRGMPGEFVLELPPLRRPRVGQVLLRSVLDRTGRVLGRAVLVAAPAGLLLWGLEAVTLEGRSLLTCLVTLLEPLGRALGMNGALLGAFILGWPANELVLPVAVLAATGTMEEGAQGLMSLGLGWETALCTAIFLLFHWPCTTTCLTIKKETGSTRWMLLAMALPTAVGVGLCVMFHGICAFVG